MSLKNLFFKDDESGNDSKKPVAQKGTETAIQNAQPITITSQVLSSVTGVVDEKFVEMLMNVIAQNNIPGQDYFEFKQAVEAMSSLPIDERTKFLTVYTTFKLQGCSKESILASIDKYMSVINSEKTNFDSELQENRRAISVKKSEIEKTKQKIEELNKQITELNTFILTTTQEAQNAEMKLQMTEANFRMSLEKVLGALTSDKDKINSYIQ